MEHEVSVITGYQALESIDRSCYDVTPVYIARDNVWFIGEELANIEFFRQEQLSLSRLTRVLPSPDAARGKLRLMEAATRALRRPRTVELDCVIPATHGTFGEDGSLQGLLDMAGVPYAGSDVRASAVGMDKLLTKAVLAGAGLPYLPSEAVHRDEFQNDRAGVIARLEDKLSYPVFVKPATLGSSVAVSRCSTRGELEEALDLALRFGKRALVERGLEGATEINCAVLDGDPPTPSVLEQPARSDELLTFDQKYRGGKKGAKGMAAQQRLIPAPIDPEMSERIQSLAVQTFQAVGAGGVARIDFLICAEGELFVNEINNIPGSFSYYLWEYRGRSFMELLTRMVERAFEIHRRRNRITYTFEANLLAGG